MQHHKEWSNVDEVVARYRLKNRRALYLLRTRGKGPRGYRFGRDLLFSEDDLIAWEESRADDNRGKA